MKLPPSCCKSRTQKPCSCCAFRTRREAVKSIHLAFFCNDARLDVVRSTDSPYGAPEGGEYFYSPWWDGRTGNCRTPWPTPGTNLHLPPTNLQLHLVSNRHLFFESQGSPKRSALLPAGVSIRRPPSRSLSRGRCDLSSLLHHQASPSPHQPHPPPSVRPSAHQHLSSSPCSHVLLHPMSMDLASDCPISSRCCRAVPSPPWTSSRFTSTCAMCNGVWTTWTFGRPMSTASAGSEGESERR